MKKLKGTSAFPGITIGKICLLTNDEEISIPYYSITKSHIKNEKNRLHTALEFVKNEINEIISDNQIKESNKNIIEICMVHLMILQDEVLVDEIKNFIQNENINAEYAINHVFTKIINLYKKKENHFKELTHDFIDLKNRLINFLILNESKIYFKNKQSSIIIATEKLTPSMVLNSKKNDIVAFIVKEGSFTTHAMILARAIGIPVIFNIDINKIKSLDNVIFDANDGIIIIEPTKQELQNYKIKLEIINNAENKLKFEKPNQIGIKNQNNIKLKINISIPEEFKLLKDISYDGIGLLRTEFLFLERFSPPTEEEQFQMYSLALSHNNDKEISIRLLDIGSDKMPIFLSMPNQINPDLEIKGARAVETFYSVFLTQAKAILRASKYGKIKILYPMVADISDLLTFKNLILNAKKELIKEGYNYIDNFEEGLMIETPAAALLSEELLKLVDFANIGSNDLLQYALAASRANKLVEQRYHIFHPVLIKLMKIIIDSAKKLNKEICLCGEISSFETLYPIMINIGLTSFSVPISKIKSIQSQIQTIQPLNNEKILSKINKAKSKKEIEKIINNIKNTKD